MLNALTDVREDGEDESVSICEAIVGAAAAKSADAADLRVGIDVAGEGGKLGVAMTHDPMVCDQCRPLPPPGDVLACGVDALDLSKAAAAASAACCCGCGC